MQTKSISFPRFIYQLNLKQSIIHPSLNDHLLCSPTVAVDRHRRTAGSNQPVHPVGHTTSLSPFLPTKYRVQITWHNVNSPASLPSFTHKNVQVQLKLSTSRVRKTVGTFLRNSRNVYFYFRATLQQKKTSLSREFSQRNEREQSKAIPSRRSSTTHVHMQRTTKYYFQFSRATTSGSINLLSEKKIRR